jgi:hypothetical protein
VEADGGARCGPRMMGAVPGRARILQVVAVALAGPPPATAEAQRGRKLRQGDQSRPKRAGQDGPDPAGPDGSRQHGGEEERHDWPGVGRLLVQAVFVRDYPIVQGTAFLIAAMVTAVTLMTDALYAWLDPRIKHA